MKFIEILGLFFGIAYLIGAILEKKWCWYAGILATIFYAISVYQFKLYGEFILQFFYIAVSIYGLSLWSNKIHETKILDLNEKPDLTISYSSLGFLTQIILMGSVFSVAFYFLLKHFNGTYIFWDAVTSGFGISTTFMTAKKKIENWIFWIVIDIILTIVLYNKSLYFYSSLYAFYTIFAAFGWYQWRKELNKIQN